MEKYSKYPNIKIYIRIITIIGIATLLGVFAAYMVTYAMAYAMANVFTEHAEQICQVVKPNQTPLTDFKFIKNENIGK